MKVAIFLQTLGFYFPKSTQTSITRTKRSKIDSLHVSNQFLTHNFIIPTQNHQIFIQSQILKSLIFKNMKRGKASLTSTNQGSNFDKKQVNTRRLCIQEEGFSTLTTTHTKQQHPNPQNKQNQYQNFIYEHFYEASKSAHGGK